MRVTSEVAPLYSTSSGMDPLSHDRNLADGDTHLLGTNPTAYAPRTLKCGVMLIVHEGGICALTTRRKKSQRGRQSGSSLESCKRICESSCSLLFADGEYCPRYEREASGLLYRPATWISVCLSLSTRQRCLSMHMHLEVW